MMSSEATSESVGGNSLDPPSEKRTDSAMRLRLYVAGQSSNSHMAVTNLSEFCRTHLLGPHEMEIVDVLREPGRALEDGVLLTPTLLVLSTDPPLRLVGNLSRLEILRQTLGTL